MKKVFSRVIPTILSVALFAGCGANNTPPAASQSKPSTSEPAAQTTGVKTGLAIATSLGKSTPVAADAEGLVQADSIIVGVIVDANGKILNCTIDSAQTKVNFNAAGQITTPLDAEIKTKNELGSEYGMGKVSSIGKEWNEQAAALADYVIGKTADEIKGIAIDNTQHATDADLKASVTISIGGYIDTIAQAVSNASDLGAGAEDKINLGTVTSVSGSKNAGADAGVAEVYSNYAVVTTDNSGKITSCVIDASQAKANIDASGKITSDVNAPVQTKNEIGAAYGLKSVSSIGKEWNEQAAAFAKYVVGKTANEVQGIAVNEEGAPSESDLTASVTIGIKNFQDIVAKAAK